MLEPAPLLDSAQIGGKLIDCRHHANAFDPHPGSGGRKVIAGHLMLVPGERVAIGKAIEDEIRQLAKERQIALAGTRPSKGDLVEGLPQGDSGKSRDHVAEIVGTA